MELQNTISALKVVQNEDELSADNMCNGHIFSPLVSWEDKYFISFILDKVLTVNNKRNQLKKVYSSKQSMNDDNFCKTKIYK